MIQALLALGAALPLSQDPPKSVSTECYSDPGWLIEAQREDGSWSARDVPSDVPGVHPGLASDDLWVSSIATLAILGDGSTSAEGKDKRRVQRALQWIVSLQRADGRIVTPEGETDLLDQAMATLALTEDRVLTGDSRESTPAVRALAYLESRALEAGAWNREGAAVGKPDPRTTAWAALAVASGRDGGIVGEQDRLTRAAAALISFNADRGAVGPRDRASELLVRLLAGESPDSASFSSSLQRLLELPLPSNPDGSGYDPELVYLQSVIAYQTGGETWKVWTKRLRKLQESLGNMTNDPPTKMLVCDPLLTRGGSGAAAGFTVLQLELYFRYARLIGAR